MLLHIIADYGHNDLAFAEVVQRIKTYLPDAEPVLTPVPAFSTIAAGFCVAQLGLNEAPVGTIIYHNVAPRMDEEAARDKNAGERLAYARLPTGVRVVGVNAGEAFSFIRDAAEELRWASVAAEGSQFRSRDLFPQAAAITLGQPDAFGDEIARGEIPEVPANRIAYIDGYGNLKATVRSGSRGSNNDSNGDLEGLASGTSVRIRIGDAEREATISDGSFAVEHGRLAFAPGSSGWTNKSGEETRWMEVFLRGGNAWEAFGRPSVGDELKITPMSR